MTTTVRLSSGKLNSSRGTLLGRDRLGAGGHEIAERPHLRLADRRQPERDGHRDRDPRHHHDGPPPDDKRRETIRRPATGVARAQRPPALAVARARRSVLGEELAQRADHVVARHRLAVGAQLSDQSPEQRPATATHAPDPRARSRRDRLVVEAVTKRELEQRAVGCGQAPERLRESPAVDHGVHGTPENAGVKAYLGWVSSGDRALRVRTRDPGHPVGRPSRGRAGPGTGAVWRW